jgi:hypothetical protein
MQPYRWPSFFHAPLKLHHPPMLVPEVEASAVMEMEANGDAGEPDERYAQAARPATSMKAVRQRLSAWKMTACSRFCV